MLETFADDLIRASRWTKIRG